MITTGDMKNPPGRVSVRILQDTRVTGIGPVKAGEIHEMRARDARLLVGMRKAEPVPDMETRDAPAPRGRKSRGADGPV